VFSEGEKNPVTMELMKKNPKLFVGRDVFMLNADIRDSGLLASAKWKFFSFARLLWSGIMCPFNESILCCYPFFIINEMFHARMIVIGQRMEKSEH
jgi:hypothetical protein